MDNFKDNFPFEKRKNEANKVLEKYPEKLPVIVTSRDESLKLDKNKYLVPKDLTSAQFLFVIRKRIIGGYHPEKAIFISVANQIVPGPTYMIDVYEQYKDLDCFLYIQVFEENTFGKLN